MTRAEYEALICKKARDAKVVPFKTVALGVWKPVESRCHPNVDKWVCSIGPNCAIDP